MTTQVWREIREGERKRWNNDGGYMDKQGVKMSTGPKHRQALEDVTNHQEPQWKTRKTKKDG